MDIKTATPAEVDTEIQRVHGVLSRATSALRKADELMLNGKVWTGEPIDKIKARQLATLHELARLGNEWRRRGGWTRWYLVPNGHLHYDVSGDRCSRIPATDHYWMTEHSGRSADEMIELAGDRVCTNCFPNAPVAPRPATARFMTPSEAERAAYREQAARVRAAKKAAQITTPEGGELRSADGYQGDLIRTEAAARRRALSDAADIALFGNSHPDASEWRETVRRIVAALAHRTGKDEVTLRAEINMKVARKATREGWEVSAQI